MASRTCNYFHDDLMVLFVLLAAASPWWPFSIMQLFLLFSTKDNKSQKVCKGMRMSKRGALWWTTLLRCCGVSVPEHLGCCDWMSLGLQYWVLQQVIIDFLQPLLLQEGHQWIPHVHHVQHLLQDLILMFLLLRGFLRVYMHKNIETR